MKNIVVLSMALLGTLFGSLIGDARAQKTDFQSWTQVTATVSLDPAKQWFLYGEAQPRVGDDISRLERLLVRPALGYNLNPNVALYLGYAWTPTLMIRG